MRKDLVSLTPLKSNFLNCEEDLEKIVKRLFEESKPYDKDLKKLLIIDQSDCLSPKYDEIVDNYTTSDLIKEGYIRTNPVIKRKEHEPIKSYIIITFDDFSESDEGSEYMDYTIIFDVITYNDYWNLSNYAIRPLKICGYIDGILKQHSNSTHTHKNVKLSGVGNYRFIQNRLVILSEEISAYSISYRGTTLSDKNRER